MSHYALGCFVENKEVEKARESLEKFFKDDKGEKGDLEGYVANHFVQKMLKPYDENLGVELSIQYTKEEVAEFGKDFINDEEIFKLSDILDKINRLYNGEKTKLELIHIFDNAEEYYYELGTKVLQDYTIDENGNACVLYNPDAAWDWYVIGGRWDGLLINKDGERSNMEKLKDVDLDAMYEDRRDMLERSFEQAEKDHFLKILSGIKAGEPKDEYVERCLGERGYIDVHAAIIEDEWYEKGSMGWFGMSDATKESIDDFKEFMKEAVEKYRDTHTIIIVDCHI